MTAHTPTPPDDERVALAEIIGRTFRADEDGCPLHLPDVVDAILAAGFRRRGMAADVVTDEMVQAAYKAFEDNDTAVPNAYGVRCMRAAITAALAARNT